MIKFAERLKELRLENNMTRAVLANKVLVSVRTISYWELGQRECNLEQLFKLSKIFNTTSDYLLGADY